MKILAWSRQGHPGRVDPETGPNFVEPDRLLTASDFVSIHLGLTEATGDLFTAQVFARMNPGAILVNTARGPIVNSDDLAVAPADGRIGAAALDVTDPEPIPSEHPLTSLPNCLIVPHIGSAWGGSRMAAYAAARNLPAGVVGGQFASIANREVYARDD